jgi:hypothetical protein
MKVVCYERGEAVISTYKDVVTCMGSAWKQRVNRGATFVRLFSLASLEHQMITANQPAQLYGDRCILFEDP